MNNKEYLEQISSEARPIKPTTGLFNFNLSPRLIKIILALVAVIFVVLIVGTIAGSGGSNSTTDHDLIDRIYFRSDNLISTISEYNRRVKSSELRSMSTSLSAVLTETTYNLRTYSTEEFGSAPNKGDGSTVAAEEDANHAELLDSLETGRLSGTLDRVYTREMAYQIGMLSALESEAISKSKSDNLTAILSSSQANLDGLYTQFNNFTTR